MCRPDDFPPYDRPTEPTEPPVNGWRNLATWSAWNWLSGDEMLFRLARSRLRLRPGATPPIAGEIGRAILFESGGPIAKRELQSAGGLDVVDWTEIGEALLELFDGDDRI